MTENLPAKKAPASLRQLLEGELFQEQISKALPKHLTPERFIRVAVTTMNRTPKLAQCDQASFFNALLTLSQLGLEPDGRRAHLIPFNNTKKGIVECQLIVDYKGIVELIYNTGDVSFIHADVVCENDEFIYDRGVLQKHQIDFKKPRGAVYAAYTLFRFKDGTEKIEVMTKEEIDAIRKRSKAADSGPWVTDYNEMAKKTTLRRGSKWIKLSPEQRDVIERDDTQFHTTAFDRPPIAEPKEKLADIPELPAECEPPIGGEDVVDDPQDDMATDPQIRAIFAILTKLKITDDYAKHEKVSNVLALEKVITSMKELTKTQASEAIKELGKGLDNA